MDLLLHGPRVQLAGAGTVAPSPAALRSAAGPVHAWREHRIYLAYLAFGVKKTESDHCLPENAMPYFPMDEPWTHVVKPLKPLLYPPPPASHHPGCPGHLPGTPRGHFQQSTLQFPHTQALNKGGAGWKLILVCAIVVGPIP